MDQAYRSRKLDLLLHLVANLTTPIVLKSASRPDTTDILRHLQGNALPNWSTCYLKGSENLDFTGIVAELLTVLRRPTQGSLDVLSAELEEQLVILDRQHKCLVLLLDHAGVLMPGMLAAISQYARLHPQLKVVCALKPEEISAKTTTDALALVDAQIVPIGQETAEVSTPAAKDVVIPPIVAPKRDPVTPRPSAPRRKFKPTLVLILIAAGVATGWLWKTIKEQPAAEAPQPRWADVPEPSVQPADNAAEIGNPLPPAETEAGEKALVDASATLPQPSGTEALTPHPLPKAEGLDSTLSTPPVNETAARLPPSSAPPEPTPSPAETPNAGLISPPLAPQPSPSAEPSPPPTTTTQTKAPQPATAPTPKGKPNTMAGVRDADWLLQQNAKSYALQLVTVSQTGNIGGLIRRMPPSDQIAVYRVHRGAGDLYFVLYGIYPTLAEASAAANMLAPNNQGRPIPRQLRAIQEDIRRSLNQAP